MSLQIRTSQKIRGISYKRSFVICSERHLKVAQVIGIRPLASRGWSEAMVKNIHECSQIIDGPTRTYSSGCPTRHTIGYNFLDSDCQRAEPEQDYGCLLPCCVRKTMKRQPAMSMHPKIPPIAGTTFDVSWNAKGRGWGRRPQDVSSILSVPKYYAT